jgi:hypothetical protein
MVAIAQITLGEGRAAQFIQQFLHWDQEFILDSLVIECSVIHTKPPQVVLLID